MLETFRAKQRSNREKNWTNIKEIQRKKRTRLRSVRDPGECANREKNWINIKEIPRKKTTDLRSV